MDVQPVQCSGNHSRSIQPLYNAQASIETQQTNLSLFGEGRTSVMLGKRLQRSNSSKKTQLETPYRIAIALYWQPLISSLIIHWMVDSRVVGALFTKENNIME